MKTKKLFLSIGMFFLMVFALCSCTLLANATSIEITEMPKTTYAIGESIGDFAIKVNYSDNSIEIINYTSTSSKGITVTNFDTTAVGTKTATIKYLSFIATFEYTVISNSDFAGGNGTEQAPYIIVNAEQLRKVNNDPSAYYRLGANIDLSAVEGMNSSLSGFESWNKCEIDKFNGVFDGASYTITMKHTDNDQIRTVFSVLTNATVKNLNLYTYGASLGLATCANFKSETPDGNVIIENVNRYGELNYVSSNANETAYFVYLTGSITFKNCDNYADIYGQSNYSSVYIGQVPKTASATANFIDCDNYGNLYGKEMAMFVANKIPSATLNLNIQNCNNYGDIVGISRSDIYSAHGNITPTDTKTVAQYDVQPIRLSTNGYVTEWSNNELVIKNETSEKVTIVVTATYYGAKQESSDTCLFALSNSKDVLANSSANFGIYNYNVMINDEVHHSIINVNNVNYYVHNNAEYPNFPNKSATTHPLNYTFFVYSEAGKLIAGGTITRN